MFVAVATKCSAKGRHLLRKLQDDDHDTMATQPEWGASVQRVRPLLQTT